MNMSESPVIPDPWAALRRHTAARIALGRAGGSLPTAEWLGFSMAHAEARDAVHSELDLDQLERDLSGLELPCMRLHSDAADRAAYLQRPDLGRRLDAASKTALVAVNARPADLALIVADGLSALAAQRQAPALLRELLPTLRASRLTLTPLVLVRQGRVAVEDEIGELLHASAAVMLIGERPGLGSADSLGAYLVFGPKPGNTDAGRNCVSNIRAEGLAPKAAAQTLAYLVDGMMRRRLSGVGLKDERGAHLPE